MLTQEKIFRKKRYQENKEKEKKQALEWYYDNREKIINNKTRQRYKKNHYSTHKLEYAEKAKEYYTNNINKVKLIQKKYKENNKERIRYLHKCDKARRRKAGRLLVKTVQLVYENNIKKYGTLTCVLCGKPIKFGQDSLEHLLPISRGGTHEYKNLAISHLSCNSSKGNKTFNEWVDKVKKRKK